MTKSLPPIGVLNIICFAYVNKRRTNPIKASQTSLVFHATDAVIYSKQIHLTFASSSPNSLVLKKVLSRIYDALILVHNSSRIGSFTINKWK